MAATTWLALSLSSMTCILSKSTEVVSPSGHARMGSSSNTSVPGGSVLVATYPRPPPTGSDDTNWMPLPVYKGFSQGNSNGVRDDTSLLIQSVSTMARLFEVEEGTEGEGSFLFVGVFASATAELFG